jgi:hypothetical protein
MRYQIVFTSVQIQNFHVGILCRVADLWANSSRENPGFLLLSNNSETRQALRDFSNWSGQMVKLLRQLIRRLSDITGVWDQFRKNSIGHFLYDGESPTASTSLKASVDAVGKVFSDLSSLLRKLEGLETELCKDNPQGVSHLFCSKLENKVSPNS